jgi:hypothetical protein
MASISSITAGQRPAKAGHWEVVYGRYLTRRNNEYISQQDFEIFSDQLDRSLVLTHYGFPMLGWMPDEHDELGLSDGHQRYTLTLVGQGAGSVSDQGGVRKAAQELGLFVSFVRAKRIREKVFDLGLDFHVPAAAVFEYDELLSVQQNRAWVRDCPVHVPQAMAATYRWRG